MPPRLASRTANACVLLIGLAMAAAALAAPVAAKTHTVVMEGTSFMPETVTVRRGDTVVWKNHDPFPHTATSREAGFDSRSIGANKSWRYIARKAGTFPYVCTLHPTMKGTLIIQ